jgi:hypothetical protein
MIQLIGDLLVTDIPFETECSEIWLEGLYGKSAMMEMSTLLKNITLQSAYKLNQGYGAKHRL